MAEADEMPSTVAAGDEEALPPPAGSLKSQPAVIVQTPEIVILPDTSPDVRLPPRYRVLSRCQS